MVPMADRRLRLVFLFVGTSIAVSLVGAETIFRLFGPHEPHAPRLLTSAGREVPAAEIASHVRRQGPVDERPHPSGLLTPDMRARQQYDHPRWGYFDPQGCIPVEHNSLGFRDREFPVEKPPGEYRVLTLGDSWTYGNGVQAADSWPKQLERLLQHGRKDPVFVVNGGLAAGSDDPSGYDDWVKQDGLGLSPDLVIVGFCLDDMGNENPNKGHNDVPMLGYRAVKTWPLTGPSHIYDYVTKLLEQRRLAERRVPDFSEAVKAAPETWNATQQGLRDLKTMLDAVGVPLIVAVFPMLSQLDPPERYPYAGLHSMVGDFCREAGIHCVELKDTFLGRRDEDLWVHSTDQHPNDAGQRMIAEGIRNWLRRTKMGP
jgi:lysophospholipase L1-like esterase